MERPWAWSHGLWGGSHRAAAWASNLQVLGNSAGQLAGCSMLNVWGCYIHESPPSSRRFKFRLCSPKRESCADHHQANGCPPSPLHPTPHRGCFHGWRCRASSLCTKRLASMQSGLTKMIFNAVSRLGNNQPGTGTESPASNMPALPRPTQ